MSARQERRSRCRGDPPGGDAADPALRRNQELRAAERHDVSSCSPDPQSPTEAAVERAAGAPCPVRNRGTSGRNGIDQLLDVIADPTDDRVLADADLPGDVGCSVAHGEVAYPRNPPLSRSKTAVQLLRSLERHRNFPMIRVPSVVCCKSPFLSGEGTAGAICSGVNRACRLCDRPSSTACRDRHRALVRLADKSWKNAISTLLPK